MRFFNIVFNMFSIILPGLPINDLMPLYCTLILVLIVENNSVSAVL
jgi:hypothetical protein